MISIAQELSPQIGDVSRACESLGLPRSTYYRAISPEVSKPQRERARPKNALSVEERQTVLDHLHSDRFIDVSPAQAFYSLLDEGIYQPEFPDRFGCYDDALSFCRGFFSRYNSQHHHSGILYLTPEVVHQGRADEAVSYTHLTLPTKA